MVSKVNEIIQSEELSSDEEEIVLLAAWFHDIGYAIDKDKHEENSTIIASNFLNKENYPAEKLTIVIACIHATKLLETPTTIVERVLRDADFAHLASSKHQKLADQLRLCFFLNVALGLISKHICERPKR